MKLAFSTLGCPDWEWNEICVTAKDLGYNGIEVRGVANETFAPSVKQFSSDNIASTIDKLHSIGLEIPIFTSAAYIYDKEDNALAMNEAKAYIKLAGMAGVRYIRVLGDRNGQPGDNVDVGFVAENYTELCDIAKKENVSVLLETNGVFANSLTLSQLLKKVNRANAGVIWDIHHTYRYFNEKPELTLQLLGDNISHVHLKDSVMDGGKLCYRMMGYGDIPILDALKHLNHAGYNQYVSFEWVKRWEHNLSEPGIAFPHFVYYMKNLFSLI